VGAVVTARLHWQEEALRRLGPAYFSEGVFAHARRGELFQHFTCLACGHRAVTWPTFRLHRRTCMAEVRIEP
jgi:hypothetical protein